MIQAPRRQSEASESGNSEVLVRKSHFDDIARPKHATNTVRMNSDTSVRMMRKRIVVSHHFKAVTEKP